MGETLADRVRRGAELLDEARPDWAAEIDALRLRMQQGCDCVLGQLWGGGPHGGGFDVGWEALALPEPADHGFRIYAHESDDWDRLYGRLDRLWLDEIARRKGVSHE